MIVTSRGQVRCGMCCRRIPRGEDYRQAVCYGDGAPAEYRLCQRCQPTYPHVARWLGWDHAQEYGVTPQDARDWAEETMQVRLPVAPQWGLCWERGGMPEERRPHLMRRYLADLDASARWSARADTDPAEAWDAEAWAAFTWKMRTSPAVNPTIRAKEHQ